MRSKTFLLASPLLVAVLAGWVLFQIKPAKSNIEVTVNTMELPLAYPEHYCAWQPGENLAFQVSSTAEVEGQTDVFQGTLSWHVENLQDSRAKIRAAFSDLIHTQSLVLESEKAPSPEGRPFYLTLNHNCGIEAVQFDNSWPQKTQELVRTQLQNWQFEWTTVKSHSWQVDHEDALGSYRAVYDWRADFPDQLTRSKTYNLSSLMNDFGLKLSPEGAKGKADFDPQRPEFWFQITGEEQLNLTMPNQPTLTIVQRFELLRSDIDYAEVPLLTAQIEPVASNEVKPEDNRQGLLSTGQRYDNYEQVLDAFDSEFQSPDPDYFNAAIVMARWLNENPQDTQRMIDLLRTSMAEDARPTAFLALELAGTEQAKQSLMVLVNDPQISKLNQARAASALADSGLVDKPAVNLLLDKTNEDSVAGTVSLMSTGKLLSKSLSNELTQPILDHLDQRLHTTQGSKKLQTIDAIGNSRHHHFMLDVVSLLADPDDRVRQHAAGALGRYASWDAMVSVHDRLVIEQQPQVRIAMISALTESKQDIPDWLPNYAPLIGIADANERVAWIDFLGGQSDDLATEFLVEMFHRETEVQLQAQIGRYVPAEKLLR